MDEPGQLVVPSPAVCHALCKWMQDEQELERVKEEAALHQGAMPLREAVPLRVGKEDAAQMLAFIPPRFYWSRRQKYGRGLFNTEAGIKDLQKHHPQFFPKQISGKIMSGYGGRGVQNHRRRVCFGRNTFTPAT